jgi:hypothetical protein
VSCRAYETAGNGNGRNGKKSGQANGNGSRAADPDRDVVMPLR